MPKKNTQVTTFDGEFFKIDRAVGIKKISKTGKTSYLYKVNLKRTADYSYVVKDSWNGETPMENEDQLIQQTKKRWCYFTSGIKLVNIKILGHDEDNIYDIEITITLDEDKSLFTRISTNEYQFVYVDFNIYTHCVRLKISYSRKGNYQHGKGSKIDISN